MRYIPHTEADVRRMLDTIGLPDTAALFAAVPDAARLGRPLDLPPPLGEQELARELRTLARRNANCEGGDWFLGAGMYPHFIPAAVDAIASRSEFYTAYTPYQPEISQGTLQTIFEWQSLICSLTGLDVANASLYDGASATAEAALMALRVTRRRRIVVSAGLHPHTMEVLRSYLRGIDVEIATPPRDTSGRNPSAPEAVDADTACLLVQQPNFLGCVEELERGAAACRARGALFLVVVSEALSLALLRAPGDQGADIVCGEAQSFGIPMSFGGPALGFLAARQTYLRQLPGRLCSETVDRRGKRGFVLTLATREQHIRRERATSNICTNQGLCLLAATVYLALLGRRGLQQLARLNFAKAQYAAARVRENPRLSLPCSAPVFNEFAIRVPDSAAEALARARDAGIVGGLELSPYAPDLGPAVLVCTTELATREAIDRLLAALAGQGAT